MTTENVFSSLNNFEIDESEVFVDIIQYTFYYSNVSS